MNDNTQEIQDAIWLQRDAAYLYARAAFHRDRNQGADSWLATKIQENAAHSARLAREKQG